MNLVIAKRKDRFQSPAYLKWIRSLPCVACKRAGIFSASTASHMKSIKFADGSDALALPACMPLHHIQSTRSSRELLEKAGIDIEQAQRDCWYLFCKEKKLLPNVNIFIREFSEAQQQFEELLIENKLGKRGK